MFESRNISSLFQLMGCWSSSTLSTRLLFTFLLPVPVLVTSEPLPSSSPLLP